MIETNLIETNPWTDVVLRWAVTGVSGCPSPSPGGPAADPVVRFGCAVSDAGGWLSRVPARVVDAVAAGWPWLCAAVVAVTVVVMAARLVYGWCWRRVVRRGYWVRLVPPRAVDVTQTGQVWRLLAGLARRAHARWRLVRPPLSFEMYGVGGGRLVAGLWLPAWVPVAVVVAEAGRAWPGVRVEPAPVPEVADAGRWDAGRWPMAGFRLAVTGSDLEPIVDEQRPVTRSRHGLGTDTDPLRAVLVALARDGGPTVLQVLVRPASGKRLAKLGHAARYPVRRRPGIGVRLLDGLVAVLVAVMRLTAEIIADLFHSGPSTPRRSNHNGHSGASGAGRSVDPVTARGMRASADKLADGPHLLASVRVAAARPDLGFAFTAARSIADGYITASRALRPVRLRRAATHLCDRWAGRGDWLLCTTTELGVLAHLPADPARYGFDTAALTRTPPTTARRARPEHGSPRGPGWTRHGWTDPPDDQEPDWEESA